MLERRSKGIALVTGGGTGVGKAIARGLCTAGWSVVISGRRLDILQDAAADIRADTTADVHVSAADVGDPVAVRALFDDIERRFGRLDLLVNNAGLSSPAVPLDELSFEDWNRVVSANLTGAFLCTQQAFRIMKAQSPQGGRIINNGSISATTPRPNSAPIPRRNTRLPG